MRIDWLDLSKLMQDLDSYYPSMSMQMRLGWFCNNLSLVPSKITSYHTYQHL